MKNTLKIDFAKSRIVMDRTFAKKCENTASKEYARLQCVRADYPEFTVVRKEIRKNSGKECYKGLTYEYMESYIARHDDEQGTIRKTYDEKRLISQCHTVRYPTIKKWFLTQYPEIAQFGVEVQEEQMNGANVTRLPIRDTAEDSEKSA